MLGSFWFSGTRNDGNHCELYINAEQNTETTICPEKGQVYTALYRKGTIFISWTFEPTCHKGPNLLLFIVVFILY